jgi:co-chaperonin GroES (HSP10)
MKEINSKRILISRLGIGKKQEDGSRAIMEDNKPLLYIADNSSDGFISDKFDRSFNVSSLMFGMVEIVDVGSDCYPFTKDMARCYRSDYGATVLSKSISINQHHVSDNSSYFFVNANGLFPVLVEDNALTLTLTLTPLSNWVTVKLDRQDKSQDLLIMPEDYEHPPLVGTVLKVGKDVDPELRDGIKVLIKPLLMVIQIGDSWVTPCSEDDIIGIIE